MKIIVAMSGGVDSSVAAALLVEKGHEVVGVTIQAGNLQEKEISAGNCSLAAVDEARKVAGALGIPHYVMNYRQPFEEKVVDYFCREYIRGRTPNPCIACNKHIKFGLFLEKALSLGADYVATGHYARILYDSSRGRYLVKRPRDKRKDQTYVLYNLTQHQAARLLMPLGEYTKEAVRQIAAQKKLPVAQKAESQDICFIDGSYHNFLKERVGFKISPGPFLDLQGKVIGWHKGTPFYTIGQRRGLGLPLGERVYVVDIDPRRNAVIVGPEKTLMSSVLFSEENNFIFLDKLEEPMEVRAQIRYKAQDAPALITPWGEKKIRVRFFEPQRAVTPGQAVVYYQNDYLVGGGIIYKRLQDY